MRVDQPWDDHPAHPFDRRSGVPREDFARPAHVGDNAAIIDDDRTVGDGIAIPSDDCVGMDRTHGITRGR